MSNEFDIFAQNEDQHLNEMLAKGKYKWTNKFTLFALLLLLIITSASAGAWYENKQNAKSTSSALSNFASLRNSFRNGGFGAGNFGGGGNPTGASNGSAINITSSAGSDVAGTVVSIDSKQIVIQTLDGTKKSFPINDSTSFAPVPRSMLQGSRLGT